MKQWHIIVSGRVQGVGFRYFAQIKASYFQIKGWVKNLDNGAVELMCVGQEEQVQMFMEELRSGNRFANVQHMEVSILEEVEEFKHFKIK